MSSYITSLPKAHCADIKSLASATLDIPPSCIEFCWDRPEFFVVGSYHLDETIRDSEKEKCQEQNNEELEQPDSDAGDSRNHQREKQFPENDVQDWGEEASKESDSEAPASVEKGKGRAAGDDNVDEDGSRMPATSENKIDNGSNNLEQHGEPGEVLGHRHPFDPQIPIKNQKRVGMLSLFRIFDGSLALIHAVTYPMGILDLHFSTFHKGVFAVASSAGCISLYCLTEFKDNDPLTCRIKHMYTYRVFPATTLVLSLAWHMSISGIMGVSLSTGYTALLEFTPHFKSLRVLRDDLNPHDELEAWTLAFCEAPYLENNSHPQAIYSGGDDSRLRCVRFPNFASLKNEGGSLMDLSPGGRKGMRGHNAGVTAILPLPLHTAAGEDILLTGSYDDYVRVYAVYDHRHSQLNKRPKVLAEVNLGGGVWRLKFLRKYSQRDQYRVKEGGSWRDAYDPRSKFYDLEVAKIQDSALMTFRILASCMHAGSRILEVIGSKYGDWEIRVLAKFEEHKSMNYGSDVQPIPYVHMPLDKQLDDTKVLVVSTSFYDKLLCVWEFQRQSWHDEVKDDVSDAELSLRDKQSLPVRDKRDS